MTEEDLQKYVSAAEAVHRAEALENAMGIGTAGVTGWEMELADYIDDLIKEVRTLRREVAYRRSELASISHTCGTCKMKVVVVS